MNTLTKTPLERVAEAREVITEITTAELLNLDANSHLIIDVREDNELAVGTLTNSLHIPRGVIEFNIMKHCEENGTSTDIILYCKTGGRSALSAEALQHLGFTNVKSLKGGYDEWTKHIKS